MKNTITPEEHFIEGQIAMIDTEHRWLKSVDASLALNEAYHAIDFFAGIFEHVRRNERVYTSHVSSASTNEFYAAFQKLESVIARHDADWQKI